MCSTSGSALKRGNFIGIYTNFFRPNISVWRSVFLCCYLSRHLHPLLHRPDPPSVLQTACLHFYLNPLFPRRQLMVTPLIPVLMIWFHFYSLLARRSRAKLIIRCKCTLLFIMFVGCVRSQRKYGQYCLTTFVPCR